MIKKLPVFAVAVVILGSLAVSDASAGRWRRHSHTRYSTYRTARVHYTQPTTVRQYRSFYAPSFFRNADGYGES